MSEPFAVLHRCAEPGCGQLAYAARCPSHATGEDADLERALDDAVVELVMARERHQEAAERVRVLRERAGIRGR